MFDDQAGFRVDEGLGNHRSVTLGCMLQRLNRVTGDRRLSTFWRYVRIQLMMFVFGIVGPIFLVMYFASQPDPTVKWAYWVGLFITAADVLIALALTAGSAPEKTPADTRVALVVAKHMQSSRGTDHESSTN